MKAGQSQSADFNMNWIFTGRSGRSENEARILYTLYKGFTLQSKGAHFENIHCWATGGEITHIPFAPSCGTAWPLHVEAMHFRVASLV